MPDTPPLSRMPPLPLSFDGPLGQKIIELHVWAVGQGLRGADAEALFDGLCRRLVGAGVPLCVVAGGSGINPDGSRCEPGSVPHGRSASFVITTKVTGKSGQAAAARRRSGRGSSRCRFGRRG